MPKCSKKLSVERSSSPRVKQKSNHEATREKDYLRPTTCEESFMSLILPPTTGAEDDKEGPDPDYSLHRKAPETR